MLYPSTSLGTSPLGSARGIALGISTSLTSTRLSAAQCNAPLGTSPRLRSLRHRSVQRGTAVLGCETWVNQLLVTLNHTGEIIRKMRFFLWYGSGKRYTCSARGSKECHEGRRRLYRRARDGGRRSRQCSRGCTFGCTTAGV